MGSHGITGDVDAVAVDWKVIREVCGDGFELGDVVVPGFRTGGAEGGADDAGRFLVLCRHYEFFRGNLYFADFDVIGDGAPTVELDEAGDE